MDFKFWGGPGVACFGLWHCMKPTPGPTRGSIWNIHQKSIKHHRFSYETLYCFNSFQGLPGIITIVHSTSDKYTYRQMNDDDGHDDDHDGDDYDDYDEYDEYDEYLYSS